MNRFLLACSLCSLLVARCPGQMPAAPPPLAVDTDDPRLLHLIAVAARRLPATDPATLASADARSGLLLGLLRLGCWSAAARLLSSAPPAACTVLQHYWYLRHSRDPAPARAGFAALAANARGDDAIARGFDDAVLAVQEALCLGGIQDQLDRIEHPARWRDGAPAPRPGTAWQQRGLQRLAQFEARYWRPADGRFAAPSLGSALLPVRLGMLTTTGDKTTRQALAALQQVRLATALPLEVETGALAALVQFDGLERPLLLAQLLDRDPGLLPPGELGHVVDAVLFAITGLRVATSPGLDEDWLRLKPGLPPGGRRVALRHVVHGAFAGDLDLDEDDGQLRVVVDPQRLATSDGNLLAVVHLAGIQHQTWLRTGTAWRQVAAGGERRPARLASDRWPVSADAELLLLRRGPAAPTCAHRRTMQVDLADQPTPAELRALLLPPDRPALAAVVLPCDFDGAAAGYRAVLADYQRRGGQLLRMAPERRAGQRFGDRWAALRADDEGWLRPEPAAAAVRLCIEVNEAGDRLLQVESPDVLQLRCDGRAITQCAAAAGQTAVPLHLPVGRHDIELLADRIDRVRLSWTDNRGRPWRP